MRFQVGIQYTLMGNPPGTDFFAVNQGTGDITIKNDLRTDPLALTAYTVSLSGEINTHII